MQTAPAQQSQPQYIISDDDKKRVERIRRAWKAYDGELEPPLRPMPNEADDNVMSNACAPIVDTGCDFLFGKELEISIDENSPKAAQDLLNTIWGEKETRIPLLQDLAMNGAMAGRAFLRIQPIDDTFRLIVVDPSIVYVQTSPQDCETVLLYCIEYSTIEQVNGRPQTVTYREEMSRVDPDDDGDNGNPFADDDATWSIQHWTKVGDAKNYTSVGDAISWPYPFAPLFSCKNLPRPNSFWGKPDVTPDIIGLNNSLNLVQSSINRTLKMFGQPILYSTGFESGTIDISPGRIIKLPTPDGKIVAVTLTSDVANGLSFAENIRSDLDELSGVPGIATGRLQAQPRGDMSGVAVELLYVTLLKKTGKKQSLYGELLLDVSKALLVLSHMSADIQLTLNWQSPLPNDDMASAQTAVAKQALGISNATLQRELGYDPEEEANLSEAEDTRKVTAFSRGQGLPPTQPQPPQNNAQMMQNDTKAQQQITSTSGDASQGKAA